MSDCTYLICCTRFFGKAYIDRIWFGFAECKKEQHGPRALGNSHSLS